MSITSSNNLAVNNSLSVNGNTILGTNSSNTLICNATITFNNPLTLNGNFVQNSGTLNTTSGTNYLNGNVIIGSTKTLTTGTGDTTVNGLLKCNGAATFTSINNSGTYNVINCSSINNSGTLTQNGTVSCNVINSSSINNAGSLTTGVVEIVDGSSPYIDFKTTGKNPDYDARIICNGGVTGTSGQGTLTISSASTVINSPISTNSTLTVSGSSTLYGVVTTANGITNSNAAIINNSTLTQTGTSVFADIVRVSPGKSLYISNNTFTDYLRMNHTGIGGNANIDFTGNFSIRNSGTTTPISIDGGTNQITLASNLNANGITNSSTLSQTGASSFNGITNSSTLSQTGASSFTGAVTNNGTLSQIGLCHIVGGANTTMPTGTSNEAGLKIYWNNPNGTGNTIFMNHGQGGYGGFTFYNRSQTVSPTKIMDLDNNGNISSVNNITANAISVSNLSTSSITTSSTSTINGIKNNSTYNSVYNYVLSGSTYYDDTSYYYTYSKNGVTGFTASNETFSTPTGYNLFRVKYKYETPVSGSYAMGYQEYIFIKRISDYPITWIQHQTSQVGNNTIFQPTFTVTDSTINIAFARNSMTSSFVTWSYEIDIV